MKARYFRSPEAFREWLEAHHDTETEVLVGFYKKHTGKQGMSWSQAVDQALCFGWIDGIGRRVDDERNTIRFTPRKKSSTWSKVNINKVTELERLGLMQPAGRAAFEARSEARTGTYSYENRPQELPPEYLRPFKKERAAWKFFEAQPPSYRRTAIWWIVTAKKEETRQKRLAKLIEDSREGRRLKQFVSPSRR
jgi:uncharacterized protein YdeI (YjbR/CyaY-like superfamily)